MMSGRPDSSEAAPYYLKYIEQVSGEDAVGSVEKQLDESIAFFTSITEQQSLHRYAPGKWSIRDSLNHLSDTERALTFRALWFARGFNTPLPSFDPDSAASGAQADRISWSEHIEEFRRVRLSTISLFRHLAPGAWLRRGIASDMEFSVRALAFIVTGHVTHHIEFMRVKYL